MARMTHAYGAWSVPNQLKKRLPHPPKEVTHINATEHGARHDEAAVG